MLCVIGAEVTPESEKKSTKEEEEEGGLPSPPLEEGAFLTTVNDMELSQVSLSSHWLCYFRALCLLHIN